MGKAGPVVEKVKFPVERDPHKLVNYCCGSNIYTEGEDIKVASYFILIAISYFLVAKSSVLSHFCTIFQFPAEA